MLNKLIFICPFKSNGCDDQIDYSDVLAHIERCDYRIVECPSYSRCGIKVLKKLLPDHEAVCAFKLTSCKFCKKTGIPRDQLENHYEECENCYKCKECLCVVDVIQ